MNKSYRMLTIHYCHNGVHYENVYELETPIDFDAASKAGNWNCVRTTEGILWVNQDSIVSWELSDPVE